MKEISSSRGGGAGSGRPGRPSTGKLDENGQIAEDLRSQILGLLSESLRYQQIIAAALADPELKRTRQELEVAMENADVVRQAVFELFQDLEGLSLEDYAPMEGQKEGMKELTDFVEKAATEFGMRLERTDTGETRIGAGESRNNGQGKRHWTMRGELLVCHLRGRPRWPDGANGETGCRYAWSTGSSCGEANDAAFQPSTFAGNELGFRGMGSTSLGGVEARHRTQGADNTQRFLVLRTHGLGRSRVTR